jgi:CubicO group peptidase (beta-lactamase class C family)
MSMLHFVRRTVPILLSLTLGAALAQNPGPAGLWQGAIETPGQALDVSVTLERIDDAWRGTIDIPAQGAHDLPLKAIAVEGDAVSFAIAGVPGTPTFDGTVDGNAMSGTFAQSGQELLVTLTRGGDVPPAAAGPQAPTPEDAAGDAEFADPEGRFTFPVPTGWEVVEADGHVTARDPSGDVRVHVVVSEGEDLDAAVRDAWSRAVPAFDLEPDETIEPPSDPGVERTALVNYDPDDDEQVYQAIAQLHEGTVYTLLFDADLAALQRRQSQLQIVATGFAISAIEDPDLSGREARPVEAVLDELHAFVEAQLEAFGIPGAAIAVVSGGEVVHADGFGATERGGAPLTADTRMMIGSTGKTMTSMLVGTLVDAGVVDWDTPVVDVLPEFRVADAELTASITLRDLLCACIGVPRRDLELFFNADDLDAEAIVEQLATFEFFTNAGEAFQYSNQLVATAGYAAAAADGAGYGELFDGYVRSLDERVLGPIGLDATTLSFEEVREAGRYAVPHQQSVDTGAFEAIDLAVEETLLPIGPAGAHWSTARDMGRYMATLLRGGVTPDGVRVVDEATLRETWEPQVPVSATESYGLGWIVGEYKGLDRFHHSGNTLGFTSEFVFVPGADVGIVVLTNGQTTNGFNGAVATRLFELIYDLPPEAEAQAAFAADRVRTQLEEAREELQDAVTAADVEPYLGRYVNPALGDIGLAMMEDQLMLDAGEFRVQVRPLLDDAGEFDRYVTYGVPVTGLPIHLSGADDGEPTVTVGQGAVEYGFERVE